MKNQLFFFQLIYLRKYNFKQTKFYKLRNGLSLGYFNSETENKNILKSILTIAKKFHILRFRFFPKNLKINRIPT